MARVIALSGVESVGKTTLAMMLAGRLRSRGHLAEVLSEPGAAAPSYRESAEFVYHDVLARFFGETRPARAYEQVQEWLRQRKWRIVEVRPQGSNSLSRFHTPTDHDDIDAIVVVAGDADYAIQVRADIELHRDRLENVVQASLDLLVTPEGLIAHEM